MFTDQPDLDTTFLRVSSWVILDWVKMIVQTSHHIPLVLVLVN